MDSDELRHVAKGNPSTIFAVDEAFGDFVEGMDSLTVRRPENVIVLLSLTKIFAIPGLRAGCAIADQLVVESVRRIQPCWSVNSVAQAVAAEALKDREFVTQSRRFITERRRELLAELQKIPQITAFPGEANFLLLRIDRNDLDARMLAERMLKKGVAVRLCENFVGLDRRFVRVAVRTTDENSLLCETLKSAFGVGKTLRKKHRTPALMFQGTSSNAGKSVLTAAMGRILLQDGLRVAPFKAQKHVPKLICHSRRL